MQFPLALLAVIALAVLGAVRFRHSGLRSLLLGLASFCAVVGTADAILRALAPRQSYLLEHPQHYDDYEGPLGSQGLPSSRTRSVATAVEGGRIVFDVHYTLDESGLRVTPGRDGTGTFLFFGGSFTYGFGVEDGETYPSRFSEALGERYRVVNAAYHGYGPNQMLRAIEARTFDRAVSRPLLHAFYLMLGDHVNRAVGFYRWNRHTARYVIGEDGPPRYAGLHADYAPMRLAHELEDLRGLPGRIGRLYQELLIPRPERIRRTLAIFVGSSELLEERYGSALTVILWDPSPIVDEVGQRLEARGVHTLRMSELVPSIGSIENGLLHPEDRILPGVEDHPNPDFYRVLGAALARWAQANVLEPKTAARAPRR